MIARYNWTWYQDINIGNAYLLKVVAIFIKITARNNFILTPKEHGWFIVRITNNDRNRNPENMFFLDSGMSKLDMMPRELMLNLFQSTIDIFMSALYHSRMLVLFLKTKRQRHDYWLLFWSFFMRPIDIYSRTYKPCFLYDSVAWCPTLIIILQVCWRNDPGLLIMSCIKNQRYSDYCCAGTFFGWVNQRGE